MQAASDGMSVTSRVGETAATTGDDASAGTGQTSTVPLDLPPSPAECDTWTQNCPEGQKCVSYGDEAWEGTTCVPVVPDPGQPGDPCVIFDHGLSGVDTCDAGSTCWFLYIGKGLEGRCISNCTGSPGEPACADPNGFCSWLSDNEFSPNLCFRTCNPLAPDCAGDDLCIPFEYPIDTFFCAPPGPGTAKPLGAMCDTSAADCEPGMFCGYTCDPGLLCCTAFCDLNAPVCPASTPQCLPWYAPGEAPPEFVNVGACWP